MPADSSPSVEKQQQRVRNILLHQLGRSARTASQLRELLLKREISPEIFEPVIQRFIETQIIDDRAFAVGFVSSRLARGGKSRSAIARELAQKGVSAELIEQSLERLTSETELADAIRLAERKISGMSSLDGQTRWRRLSGFLMRRGYSSGVVTAAIRAAEASVVKSGSNVITNL